MRLLPQSVLLLSCGLFFVGCEELIGAEFSDFERQRDGAPTPTDGGSVDESSDDVDAKGGEIADTNVPPPGDAGGSSCTPGELHDIAGCANCGRYVQICKPEGVWDQPVCRQMSGACPPGTAEQRACEVDGTQTATCTSSCTWTLDTCVHSPCMRDQIEKQPCGSCGAQSRACQATDAGWKWTPFSACMDEKPCAPNQVERGSCGNCGTHARVCNMLCSWGSWDSCEGEGECAVGDTQERGCLIGLLRQTRTCSDQCAWGPWIGLCL